MRIENRKREKKTDIKIKNMSVMENTYNYISSLYNFMFKIYLIFMSLVALCASIFMVVVYGYFVRYVDGGKVTIANFGIICMAAYLLAIGVIGLAGALSQNEWVMRTLFKLLLVFVIVSFIAGMYFVVTRKSIEHSLHERLDKMLQKAISEYQQGQNETLNSIQNTFSCCGRTGPADYDVFRTPSHCASRGNAVPSCHVGNSCRETLKTIGCRQKLIEFFIPSDAIVFVIIGVLIAGIFFSRMFPFNKKRNRVGSVTEPADV